MNDPSPLGFPADGSLKKKNRLLKELVRCCKEMQGAQAQLLKKQLYLFHRVRNDLDRISAQFKALDYLPGLFLLNADGSREELRVEPPCSEHLAHIKQTCTESSGLLGRVSNSLADLEALNTQMQHLILKDVQQEEGEAPLHFLFQPSTHSGALRPFSEAAFLDETLAMEKVLSNSPSSPMLASELAILKSRDTMRELLDTTHNYLLILNNEFYIEACNGSWAKSINLHPRHVVGSPLQQYLPHETFQLLEAAMHRCLSSGQPESIQTSSNGKTFEWTIQAVENDKGEYDKLTLDALEVTKYCEEDPVKKEYLHQYELLFKHTADLVIVHDDKGRLLKINHAASKLLGIPKAQAANHSIEQFISQDLSDYLSVLSGKETLHAFRADFTNPEGLVFPVELSVCRFLFNSAPAYLCIGRDDREVRKLEAYLEEAREAMEWNIKMKNEFLANISHELRTPLSAIFGYTELIAKGPIGSEQRLHLDRILSASEMLSNLINDLLDATMLEAGVLNINSAPFNLLDIMNELRATFTLKAAQKGIEFFFRIDDDVPTMLQGSPLRLRQIFFNLVGNAIKFTESGFVGITISIDDIKEIFPNAEEHAEQDGIWLHFKVQDTGIGIHQNDIHRIFQRFVQVEGADNRSYEGTGLGLTISKNLVEIMGGSISVKSTPGGGSTFQFSLPLRLAEQDISDLPPIEVAPSTAPLTILLVEDNEFNRDMIQAACEFEGHLIRYAKDGLEALEALQTFLPDLILMDLQMPRFDGFEATQRIRSHPDSRIASLPIIAMSAHGQEEVVKKCQDLGMDGFISKPFRLDVFYAKLQAINTNEPGSGLAPDRHEAYGVSGGSIDKATLLENMSGNHDQLLFACKRFIDHSAKLQEELRTAMSQADMEELARLGHMAKSVCATMGAKDAADLASSLEAGVKDNAPMDAVSENATSLIQALEAARDHVAAMLQQGISS